MQQQIQIRNLYEKHAGQRGSEDATSGKYSVTYIAEVIRLGPAPDGTVSELLLNSEQVRTKSSRATTRPGNIALATHRSAECVDTIMRTESTGYEQPTEIWHVTLEYQPVTVYPFGVYAISGSSQRHEEFFLEDITGKALLNSAWDYYNPPPPRYKHNQKTGMRVRYYRGVPATLDPIRMGWFLDCVNKDQFAGYQPGELLFQDFQWEVKPLIDPMPWWESYNPDYYYFDVTYVFERSPFYGSGQGGWHPTKVLDVGPRCWIKNASGGYSRAPSQATDGKGIKHGGKILLDGNGCSLLDPSLLGKAKPPNVKPVYREFQLYWTYNFSELFDHLLNGMGKVFMRK